MAQDGPKIAQNAPKMTQDGPGMAQDGPKMVQDGSKMALGLRDFLFLSNGGRSLKLCVCVYVCVCVCICVCVCVCVSRGVSVDSVCVCVDCFASFLFAPRTCLLPRSFHCALRPLHPQVKRPPGETTGLPG